MFEPSNRKSRPPTEFLSMTLISSPAGIPNDDEVPLNGSRTVIPYLLPITSLSLG